MNNEQIALDEIDKIADGFIYQILWEKVYYV